MKKVIVLLTLVMLIFAVGCSKEKKHSEHEKSEQMAKTEYYCPMECEGDKTYTDKDAKCPVCKMDLVEKKAEMSDKEHKHKHENGEEHSHEGDEHQNHDEESH